MPHQQAWPPASTDCPQGAQVSGDNQYWQYQPPGQPLGPVPRRRGVGFEWFVIIAGLITLATVIFIVVGLFTGHSASYNMGYSFNLPDVDQEMSLAHGEVSPDAICMGNLAATHQSREGPPPNDDDWYQGCMAAFHDKGY
jgi:hypothetical protein